MDAVLDIPPDPITSKVGIDWDTYKVGLSQQSLLFNPYAAGG